MKTMKRRNLVICCIVLLPMILMAVTSIFHDENKIAQGYVSSGASIGSLTLADYATRTDGYVFDGDVIQKLYDKITGSSNSTYSNAWTKSTALPVRYKVCVIT